MKISLLHPSRGRSDKFLSIILDWLENASGSIIIEYVLSLDYDDSEEHLSSYLSNYLLLHNTMKIVGLSNDANLIIGPSQFVVGAVNRAARIATGDVSIMISDDFACFKNWDIELMQSIPDASKPFVVQVSDNCTKKTDVITLPIMTKAFYDKCGYFFHPYFKSMWADNYLYSQAVKYNCLINAMHLKFTHHHFTNDNVSLRNEFDNTYDRSNAFYDEGKEIFLQLTNQ